jgi:hypothetical protein
MGLLLQCMSPLLAQSGHAAHAGEYSLLAAERAGYLLNFFGASLATHDPGKQKLVAACSPISSGIRTKLSVPQAKRGRKGQKE